MKSLLKMLLIAGLLGLMGAGLTLAQESESESAREGKRDEKKSRAWYRIKGVEWKGLAGVGYDTNVYESPSGSYVDYGRASTPTENPQIQSGLFIPLALEINYTKSLTDTNNLLLGGDYSGEFHLEAAQQNADEYGSEIKIGDRQVFQENKSLEHSVYAGINKGKNRKLFLDHDSGVSKTGAVKYTYQFTEYEVNYLNEMFSLVRYRLGLSKESRDYETPQTGDEYDVNIDTLFADLDFHFIEDLKLQLGYKTKNYAYETRRSRDLTGALVAGQPVNYDYSYLNFGFDYNFSESFTLFMDIKQITRKDNHVGYADYTMLQKKVRGLWKLSQKIRFRVSVTLWDRSYPNAFAFDNNTQEAKAYDGKKLSLQTTYRLSKNRHWDFEFFYKEQNSTDLRYDYDKIILTATMTWNY